jgi:hypothetical protein
VRPFVLVDALLLYINTALVQNPADIFWYAANKFLLWLYAPKVAGLLRVQVTHNQKADNGGDDSELVEGHGCLQREMFLIRLRSRFSSAFCMRRKSSGPGSRFCLTSGSELAKCGLAARDATYKASK